MSACRGSNDVISPCDSSEVTVRGQSADPLGEDADNELLWEGWAAFWAHRCCRFQRLLFRRAQW